MRYELRVAGRMSELACHGFPGMQVIPVPAQSIIYGQVADDAHLHDLLALCQSMGLRVISVQETPSSAVTTDGGSVSTPGAGSS
ncbi:MAG TPA: hypothetical protein VK735_11380 [Pseudonocardia sp.]|uniref:hypothetical protein n=1 Tax=Pseudonocardia sp. TaxID=60912 RepID=UPI002CC19636|nr:hypothetical protein [Pseudonocardia sp.]HTF48044.1 hypothetical protein [Pseudonocardia sp.]